jgi:hypothetical protein
MGSIIGFKEEAESEIWGKAVIEARNESSTEARLDSMNRVELIV